MNANALIESFKLIQHPEGGWYRENYRSGEEIEATGLPERFGNKRSLSTAIYFLLEAGNFSAFHRIKSDECWHFYAGDPLEVLILAEENNLQVITLGNNPEAGELFQYVVPAGCWFASRPAAGSSFSFVGCTVSPGFDFDDFELASASILSREYPAQQEIIQSLCRK